MLAGRNTLRYDPSTSMRRCTQSGYNDYKDELAQVASVCLLQHAAQSHDVLGVLVLHLADDPARPVDPLEQEGAYFQQEPMVWALEFLQACYVDRPRRTLSKPSP